MKLLLVDDEPLVIRSFTQMIDWGHYGFDAVFTAANGMEALDVIEREKDIDIVVTDVDMPVMDGIELARRIGDGPYTASLLFLSAYGNFEFVRSAFKFGAVDYILKSELDEKTLPLKVQEMVKARKERLQGPEQREEEESYLKRLFSLIIGKDAIADDACNQYGKTRLSLSSQYSLLYFRLSAPKDILLKYKDQLSLFTNAVKELIRPLLHEDQLFVPITFDQYVLISLSGEDLQPFFDHFVEIAWQYLDVDFDGHVSLAIGSVEELKKALDEDSARFVSYSRLVMRSRRYVAQHYREPTLSLSDIAAFVEVSKNHLSGEYSKETGETLIEYISSVRVRAAVKMLRDTALKTYEIAESVGFSNVETFSRTFRKITGRTPRQY